MSVRQMDNSQLSHPQRQSGQMSSPHRSTNPTAKEAGRAGRWHIRRGKHGHDNRCDWTVNDVTLSVNEITL